MLNFQQIDKNLKRDVDKYWNEKLNSIGNYFICMLNLHIDIYCNQMVEIHTKIQADPGQCGSVVDIDL